MPIDLSRLLQRSFFTEQLENATESIERAREKFVDLTQGGAVSFEVVAPPDPDADWARDRLLRPLVYYCESEGASVPLCPGIFVSLFVGDRLHCVAAAEVLEWAHGEFGLSTEQLRDQYGTAESPAP